MLRPIAAPIVACLISALATPALAQAPNQQVQLCENDNQQYSKEQQIDGCTAIIQSGGDVSWAYYNRGVAHVDRGESSEAIADYTESIRLNPKSADAYVNRGTAYHRQSKYDLAVADYDKAIELDSEPHADVYANRGNSYRRWHNYTRAIADLTRAIEIDPNYSFAYFYRGGTYSDQKLYQRAIADFDSAIKLNSDYAKAYYARGLAERSLGKTAAANADIAKAKELDPHVSD